MKHPTEELHALKKQLSTWLDHLKRATGASAVTFYSVDGGFGIMVRWEEGATRHVIKKVFTSRTIVRGKRTCDYVRDISKEIMRRKRGTQ